jgi:hypothetical protein
MFNAVAIEHAFAAFTGDYSRLGVVDADVFRAGDPKDLGALLILFAQRLRQRTEFLEFTPGEARNGGAKPRLQGGIERLAEQGEELKQRPHHEPEDYHWEIIGTLVWCITGLVEHLEGKEVRE